jgi:MoxR-like ATPase
MHTRGRPSVLLIDELDRADEEFEGFLLEFLGEFQVTIPELGTFKAREPPIVIITSNRTRELGDGLRRRCLYLRVDYPSQEKELEIVKIKVPGINESLANEIIRLTQRLRKMETLAKKPGVAETIDWASAILALGHEELDEETVRETLGCVVKTADELQHLQSQDIGAMIAEARSS